MKKIEGDAEMTSKELKEIILNNLIKIGEEASILNNENEVPLIISENDLCIEIVPNIKKQLPENFYIKTEFSMNSFRYDIIIFNKNQSKYTYNDTWGRFDITDFEAILELGGSWGESKKGRREKVKKDIIKLSQTKNTKIKIVVFFDYDGHFSENELKNLLSKYNGVDLFYQNLKTGKYILLPEL